MFGGYQNNVFWRHQTEGTPLATPLVGAFDARLSATKILLVAKFLWKPETMCFGATNSSYLCYIKYQR